MTRYPLLVTLCQGSPSRHMVRNLPEGEKQTERQEAEGLVELAEMLSLLQLRARRVTQRGPYSP